MKQNCTTVAGALALALIVNSPIAGRGAATDEDIAKKLGIAVEQVQQLHTARALSSEALEQFPAERIPRLIRRLDYPDLPHQRAAFRVLQEQDERGQVQPNALPAALRQLQELRKGVPKPTVSGLPTGGDVAPEKLLPPTAGLNPGNTGWTSLGPGNIGGRTRSIILHPTEHQRFWLGSVGGGVWQTLDGGASFSPVNDLMANLAVSAMVMDPTDANIIYAGTGEGFYNVDALRGAGIFRTTDGTNWSQIPSTKGADFFYVNRLAISADGKVLLAATRRPEDSSTGGIYRSEDQQRTTWSKRLPGDFADIDFHPTDSNKAIASGLSDGQAYYSTDGGKTWTPASHPGQWSGRVEVAYSKKNPSIVYASVNINRGEIWRSSDGGRSYVKKGTALAGGAAVNYLGQQGWYDNVIWAGDPTDENLVIVGGVDLWKSTNGGDTLIDISTWWDSRSAHADHHVIATHPGFNGTTNKTVFFGNDGGIYKTDDIYTVGNNSQPPRFNGWKGLNNTYGVTQLYGAAGNVQSGTIVAGAQDNGTLRYTKTGGSEKWTEMFGGDGGFCAADPADQNIFYGEYVYGNVHRSNDGGATSEYISGQYWNGAAWVWKPIPYSIRDSEQQQALFIAPFVLDPNDANRMLVGCRSLWRTTNAKAALTNATGPRWTPIKPPAGGQPISAIGIASGAADLIYVGHSTSGDVFKTTNGTSATPTWIKVDDQPGSSLPNRFCTRLVIDPRNHEIVYALFGGYSRGNLWRTMDGGQRWANIGNALPEAPVRTLAIHPNRSDFIYVGTEVGVFASEDSGATWSPTNEGPTSCSVDELIWMDKTLVAATHGRGIFTIDLATITQPNQP
jgi:photosystem II stability/assembly factor-like uncharacterized protein